MTATLDNRTTKQVAIYRKIRSLQEESARLKRQWDESRGTNPQPTLDEQKQRDTILERSKQVDKELVTTKAALSPSSETRFDQAVSAVYVATPNIRSHNSVAIGIGQGLLFALLPAMFIGFIHKASDDAKNLSDLLSPGTAYEGPPNVEIMLSMLVLVVLLAFVIPSVVAAFSRKKERREVATLPDVIDGPTALLAMALDDDLCKVLEMHYPKNLL